MAYKPALNQFNGGEISPQLEGRIDWDKYNYSAKLCQNFIPLVEGSLKRRGGSHFVYSPETFKTYTLVFKITCDVTPTLTVDGKTVNLTNEGNVWTSTQLVYPKGQGANYNIEAEGYLPIYDTYYVKSDTTLEKTMELGETVKLYIYSFTDDIDIEVNNKPVAHNGYTYVPLSYLDENWELTNPKYFRVLVTYKGQMVDKLFTTLRDRCYLFIMLLDDNLLVEKQLSENRENIIDTSSISTINSSITKIGVSNVSHTMILPLGTYDAYCVGGGGASFVVANDTYVGGGAGCARGTFEITEYNKKLFIETGDVGIGFTGQTKGGDTSISDVQEIIISATGGDSDYPNAQGIGGGYIISSIVTPSRTEMGKGSGESGDYNYSHGCGSTYAQENNKVSVGLLELTDVGSRGVDE